ncbi:hypothetical protein Rcae01_01502 [Novipirellula caenicola]|uniref:Amine oxidase domain-containing protein n=1 Tax=Novipirellula caenicola TaxID=1536901 RepID=A0ABP9VLH4_9BACT
MESQRVSDSPPMLNRRDLMTLLLGSGVAATVGCSRQSLPPEGELLSPDLSVGHRIRDGWRPVFDPSASEHVDVLIVGGGIAGLSTAWRLKQAGFEDFRLLEIEKVFGGTSRSGQTPAFEFPWGAHYVPAPMKENRALLTLLEEMSVVVGKNDDGSPQVAEQYLCRDPEERVFVDGEWIEGLYPYSGASAEDLHQLKRFQAEIDAWVARRDDQGRRMFAIPIATASDGDVIRSLDQISMQQWMDEHDFSSPRLRWLVDYSCRDDYGLTTDQTSAWAGIFYFASRAQTTSTSTQDVMTWPEGNGRFVKHFVNRVQDHLRPATAVCDIQLDPAENDAAKITAWDSVADHSVNYDAEHVVFAAPQFLAPYLIRDFQRIADRSTRSFWYGSWVVANVHLRDRPQEDGMPMCWDNVIYESKSLGYVTSTHQTGLDHGATVLTWYYPLTQHEGKLSRQQLLGMTWSDWAEIVMADLSRPHPEIASLIARIDIMRWGHAMIQPRPGFVFSDDRRQASKPIGNLHFAGTDLSGVALMEEAFYHGVRAAEEVLAKQNHPFESLL